MKIRLSLEDAAFLAMLALAIVALATGNKLLALVFGLLAVGVIVRVAARVLRRPGEKADEPTDPSDSVHE